MSLNPADPKFSPKLLPVSFKSIDYMNDTVLNVIPVPVRTWVAIAALGISAFSIVTSELAPVGMLSMLAKDLNQTESDTDLVVTAYGWVGALAALLSGLIPARISRKSLLVTLMVVFALSCVAATQSSLDDPIYGGAYDRRFSTWCFLGFDWSSGFTACSG
ncbi:membrane protein of unknown function [Escherichia coli]|nr:membrane protein of unknown function [Escherichia coli]